MYKALNIELLNVISTVFFFLVIRSKVIYAYKSTRDFSKTKYR